MNVSSCQKASHHIYFSALYIINLHLSPSATSAYMGSLCVCLYFFLFLHSCLPFLYLKNMVIDEMNGNETAVKTLIQLPNSNRFQFS